MVSPHEVELSSRSQPQIPSGAEGIRAGHGQVAIHCPCSAIVPIMLRERYHKKNITPITHFCVMPLLTLTPVVLECFSVWCEFQGRVLGLTASLQRQSKCWFVVSPPLADPHVCADKPCVRYP